ncbi:MAG: hypothetical protein Ct9H300mP18_12560 [Candidatus Neomarinimicrobiota bacterium]|nr:MAG: hypothetical protein Ct9H300mP18_12560 [Candidatus Neomarinimicrobiota bacterium]
MMSSGLTLTSPQTIGMSIFPGSVFCVAAGLVPRQNTGNFKFKISYNLLQYCQLLDPKPPYVGNTKPVYLRMDQRKQIPSHPRQEISRSGIMNSSVNCSILSRFIAAVFFRSSNLHPRHKRGYSIMHCPYLTVCIANIASWVITYFFIKTLFLKVLSI